MSYTKTYKRHSTDVLVIPNDCLVQFQRLFETGLIFKVKRKKDFTNTLIASSQTRLLLQVLLTGWVASAAALSVEIWTHRNMQTCRKWRVYLEKYLYIKPMGREALKKLKRHRSIGYHVLR